MYFSLKMLTFLSLKVLIRINYRVGGCNSNEFLNDILCNINLHIFWAIFLSIKSWKPQPQRMVCTCAQSTMKCDIPVTRGWRKLNFVACKWNHKIYFSMRLKLCSFLETNYNCIYSTNTVHPPTPTILQD